MQIAAQPLANAAPGTISIRGAGDIGRGSAGTDPLADPAAAIAVCGACLIMIGSALAPFRAVLRGTGLAGAGLAARRTDVRIAELLAVAEVAVLTLVIVVYAEAASTDAKI
jgi:hypothetical protein